MRAAMFLEEWGELEAFTREAFALYWEEGGAPKGLREADEDGPVSEAVRRIGTDPDEVLAGASAPEAKEALKKATGEAVERAFSGRQRSLWGTRCSGATTGCTSSRRRSRGAEGVGPRVRCRRLLFSVSSVPRMLVRCSRGV
jgi:hypothetical protein